MYICHMSLLIYRLEAFWRLLSLYKSILAPKTDVTKIVAILKDLIPTGKKEHTRTKKRGCSPSLQIISTTICPPTYKVVTCPIASTPSWVHLQFDRSLSSHYLVRPISSGYHFRKFRLNAAPRDDNVHSTSTILQNLFRNAEQVPPQPTATSRSHHHHVCSHLRTLGSSSHHVRPPHFNDAAMPWGLHEGMTRSRGWEM